ncbi:hypothetical protein PPYR_14791 [Photinus pyralis]|uniref:Alcohol dehydrogenase n=1 Tax=Photinus pyralis TaxID=7054 RepID=A0A5N4A692_PHOPY|nr:15-hydroxyprostaglandin dehydrogenase [NAD(+)]-like isoform X2 [Photinus pyralis]KAB0792832.1 hypothetical protein PPYR_14791 [Photinus pyralis]
MKQVLRHLTTKMLQTVIVVALTILACASSTSNHSYDFIGKFALVTGGNRGIGLGITSALLENGVKGVTMVHINPTRSKEAVDSLGAQFGQGRVIVLIADVSDEKQLEEAFKKSIAHWGGLDIVINNAGVVNENNPVRLTNINAIGVMHGTLLGMRHMSVAKGGRGGVVINISSIYGIDHLFASPVYSATKAYVLGLGRAFGHESYYDQTKVRVLTLCPGLTDTELLSKVPFKMGISNEFIPDLIEIAYALVDSSYLQSPHNLGRAVTVMLQCGASGSVWVAEDEQLPYEIDIPVRTAMKKQ